MFEDKHENKHEIDRDITKVSNKKKRKKTQMNTENTIKKVEDIMRLNQLIDKRFFYRERELMDVIVITLIKIPTDVLSIVRTYAYETKYDIYNYYVSVHTLPEHTKNYNFRRPILYRTKRAREFLVELIGDTCYVVNVFTDTLVDQHTFSELTILMNSVAYDYQQMEVYDFVNIDNNVYLVNRFNVILFYVIIRDTFCVFQYVYPNTMPKYMITKPNVTICEAAIHLMIVDKLKKKYSDIFFQRTDRDSDNHHINVIFFEDKLHHWEGDLNMSQRQIGTYIIKCDPLKQEIVSCHILERPKISDKICSYYTHTFNDEYVDCECISDTRPSIFVTYKKRVI